MQRSTYVSALCLVLTMSAAAQVSNQQNAGAFSPALKIFVLQGQDAVNSTVTKAITIPVVEVRDENDRPVEGATVIFEAPASGPGGVFVGGKPIYQTISAVNGQAVGRGFTFNDQPGPFVIRVTSRLGLREGRVEIRQAITNKPHIFGFEAMASRPWWKKWWVLGLIGGGITGGVYAGTRGDGSSGGNTSIGIVPGPITIGGSR